MKIKHLIFFFTILIAVSCNDSNNCLKDIGERIVVSENIDDFYILEINSIFDITIIDSSLYSISIEGYSNILDLIDRDVENGILRLKNNYECSWLKREDCPKITITAPRIDSIFVNEACDLHSKGKINYNKLFIFCPAKIFNCELDLNCNDFWLLAMATTGNYKLRGNAYWVFLQNVGNGFLDAGNLECYHLDLQHASIGETRISCYGELNIERIKHSYVYLFTSQCPKINFTNPEDKKLFFTENCM